MKLNLPILLVVVGQREKSQKYFDPSTFNKNLNDLNPCSSLGVMNFQKWELFLAHPVFSWEDWIPGIFYYACKDDFVTRRRA